MDTVRWGLLSTANINRRLIPAIRMSRRGKLVAVASRDRASAQAYAKDWEIPLAFGSYEEMLASDQVDAVYISLPNHLHAEWSIRAMQAGKHALCEKPLALSLDEVDRMTAASRATGCALMEAFMYRHHPQTKIAGEWVRKGRLGEIVLVRSAFNFYMGNRLRKDGWLNVRLVPEFGGGSLWDVGCYPVSFAQFIYGSAPTWVLGSQWIGDSGVDESFAGLMHYPEGGDAQAACAFRTPLFTHAEVIGSEGILVFTRPFFQLHEDRQLLFIGLDDEPVEVPVPEMELYLGEIEDMHDAILEGKPIYLTLEESRDHIRTILALYESARTNKSVHL